MIEKTTSDPIQEISKWYAVHVHSNQEKTTAAFLKDRGIELFLPTYRVQSKRSDRKVALVKPLFTGYLFVHIQYRSIERIKVLRAPGIVEIVGCGEHPVPIRDETILSLKILVCTKEGSAKPHPLVKAGNPVEVVDGPFSGATGILYETPGRK